MRSLVLPAELPVLGPIAPTRSWSGQMTSPAGAAADRLDDVITAAGAGLFAPAEPGAPVRWPRPHWTIAVTTALIALVALAIGFAPQIVFDAAAAR